VPGHGPSAANVIRSNNAGCSVGVPATFFQPAIALHLSGIDHLNARARAILRFGKVDGSQVRFSSPGVLHLWDGV
jgi:hypothetical protein